MQQEIRGQCNDRREFADDFLTYEDLNGEIEITPSQFVKYIAASTKYSLQSKL